MDNDIWLVSYIDYYSGFFDKDIDWVETVGENPFTPKVLPMSPVWTEFKVYPEFKELIINHEEEGFP